MEGSFVEGALSAQVFEGLDDGELVADAEEEAAVGKGPEVLGAVAGAPEGAGEDLAGGKFEQERCDVAVVVLGGGVREAGEELAGVEGEEEVGGVDEVEGVEGGGERVGGRWGVADRKSSGKGEDGVGGFGLGSGVDGGCGEEGEEECGSEAAARRLKRDARLYGGGDIASLVLLFHRRGGGTIGLRGDGFVSQQRETQVPCGNDNQNGNSATGNRNSRDSDQQRRQEIPFRNDKLSEENDKRQRMYKLGREVFQWA